MLIQAGVLESVDSGGYSPSMVLLLRPHLSLKGELMSGSKDAYICQSVATAMLPTIYETSQERRARRARLKCPNCQ